MPEPALKLAEKPAAHVDADLNFRRIGTPRVNRALKAISLIGYLSNRSVYSYSDDDVKKLFAALRAEIDAAEAKFAPAHRDQAGFTF